MTDLSNKSRPVLFMGHDWRWWVRTGFYLLFHPWQFIPRVIYNVRRAGSDVLAVSGYYRYPNHIIFIAGMPMSASTWVKNLLARIPGYYTRATPMPWDIQYTQGICDSAFRYVPKHGYTLFKTHLRPSDENFQCILRNGVEKVVVTYRDLRDVAVSRYYRLIDFPKSPSAFDYVDYRSMGKEKALDHSIEIIPDDYVSWIRGWFSLALRYPGRIHFVKFEDLKRNTKGEFGKILEFYDIDISDENIEKIIDAAKGMGNVKNNITKAPTLPWAYSSNFRTGKVGNWKSEFTDSQIQKCKKLFGEALIELGYEKDLEW